MLLTCWSQVSLSISLSNLWVGLKMLWSLFLTCYLLLLLIHVPSQKTSCMEGNFTSFYTLRDQLLFCTYSSRSGRFCCSRFLCLTRGFLVLSLIGGTFTAVYVLQSVAVRVTRLLVKAVPGNSALVTLVIPDHPDLSFFWSRR